VDLLRCNKKGFVPTWVHPTATLEKNTQVRLRDADRQSISPQAKGLPGQARLASPPASPQSPQHRNPRRRCSRIFPTNTHATSCPALPAQRLTLPRPYLRRAPLPAAPATPARRPAARPSPPDPRHRTSASHHHASITCPRGGPSAGCARGMPARISQPLP
jgi:hypothetical protein